MCLSGDIKSGDPGLAPNNFVSLRVIVRVVIHRDPVCVWPANCLNSLFHLVLTSCQDWYLNPCFCKGRMEAAEKGRDMRKVMQLLVKVKSEFQPG